MSKSIPQMLREFHSGFGVEQQSYKHKPVRDLRLNLIQEEMEEVNEAFVDADPAEMLGEMADLVIVLFGAADVFDWDLKEAVRRKMLANMTKLGDDGKPLINGVNAYDDTRPMGKILKSPNYQPAYLGDLV